MIELEGVTKLYGRSVGVRDLTFSVGKGEVVGLLGPNAAGKTTTMRIITGYMPPTSGRVRVAGFDVVERPTEVKRRIGYLPEHPPLYNDMTVRSYLAYAAELKEVPARRRRARVAEVMDRLELGPVADRLIGNVSRGFKQRVGLAQALINDPEVVVLDEPTLGLDPKQIIEMRKIIVGLGGDHTVILSTHILPEVSMVCQRVVIIDHGSIVAVDTPDRLAERLRSSRGVLIRVKGSEAEAGKVLSSAAGVRSVTRLDGESAEGFPAFELESDPDEDPREAVFFALSRAGIPIMELRPVRMSLEEVFLRLTTRDRGDGERDGQPVPGGEAPGAEREVTGR